MTATMGCRSCRSFIESTDMQCDGCRAMATASKKIYEDVTPKYIRDTHDLIHALQDIAYEFPYLSRGEHVAKITSVFHDWRVA